MSEVSHTPTPWKVVKELKFFNGMGMVYISIQPEKDTGNLDHLMMVDGSLHICRFSHTSDELRAEKRKADAAFLVEAVNSHAALQDRVRRLEEALTAARKRMRNCRGAIESNQVVDKDVHGSLTRGMADIDAALGKDRPPQNVKITALFDGEWAPECSVRWSDLCADCRAVSLKFFQGLPHDDE